jgi:hypothetical protein
MQHWIEAIELRIAVTEHSHVFRTSISSVLEYFVLDKRN